MQEGAELLLNSDSAVEFCEQRQNFKRRTGGVHFVHKIVLRHTVKTISLRVNLTVKNQIIFKNKILLPAKKSVQDRPTIRTGW